MLTSTLLLQFAAPNICITLVGNKADVTSKRVITREEGQAFADDNGLQYVEASAKSAGKRSSLPPLCGAVLLGLGC